MMGRTMGLLLAGSLLSGCAFKPQLQSVAVDHSRLVADSANEITLLNIVRSSKRQPMHFTSMKVLRGNLSISASGDLGIGINKPGRTDTLSGSPLAVTERELTNGADSYSPKLSGSITTNPSFEAAIYDNEKFQRGIMKQIEASQFDYFLKSGWPTSFISKILVESINICTATFSFDEMEYKKDESCHEIDNDPESKFYSGLDYFFQSHKIRVEKRTESPTKIGALADLSGAGRLADIAILDGEKFDVKEDGQELVIERKGQSSEVMTISYDQRISTPDKNIQYFRRIDCQLGNRSIKALLEDVAARLSSRTHKEFGRFESASFDESKKEVVASFVDSSRKQHEARIKTVGLCDSSIGLKPTHLQDTSINSDQIEWRAPALVFVDVTLRSTDGALYFLGEFVREFGPCRGESLFAVHSKEFSDRQVRNHCSRYRSADHTPLLSTTWNGHRFFISTEASEQEDDGSQKDRSTQTLGFIQQLINLHKSAEDLPTASSIVVSP